MESVHEEKFINAKEEGLPGASKVMLNPKEAGPFSAVGRLAFPLSSSYLLGLRAATRVHLLPAAPTAFLPGSMAWAERIK